MVLRADHKFGARGLKHTCCDLLPRTLPQKKKKRREARPVIFGGWKPRGCPSHACRKRAGRLPRKAAATMATCWCFTWRAVILRMRFSKQNGGALQISLFGLPSKANPKKGRPPTKRSHTQMETFRPPTCIVHATGQLGSWAAGQLAPAPAGAWRTRCPKECPGRAQTNGESKKRKKKKIEGGVSAGRSGPQSKFRVPSLSSGTPTLVALAKS